MTPDERRPLVEHLEELRARLWWCLLAVAAGAGVTYAVRAPLLRWLIAPVGRVVFTSLAEPFLAELKLAGWGGLLLGSPIILWQAWEFAGAGLRERERRVIGRLLPVSVALFLGGAWCGLTWLVPTAVRFFLGFAGEQMTPMISVGRYLGLVGSLTVACGLVAQTPLVVGILAALGLVTPAFLWHHWRGALVGSFVVAAVVTPTPDVVTQTLVAIPLIVLYLFSIGLAALLQPKPRPLWKPSEVAHDARGTH